jgi:hypothetical protein
MIDQREVGDQGRALRQVPHFLGKPLQRARSVGLCARPHDFTPIRRGDPGEYSREGRLAGTVLAHDRVNLSGSKLDRHLIESESRPETLDDRRGGQCRLH